VDEHEFRVLTTWIRKLRIIIAEIRSLLLSSKVFWEVQKILEANPDALCHRLFNDWMATNYGNATTMGIRRQIDLDSRSVSVMRLLLQIRDELVHHPDILSREKFVRNYPPQLRWAGEKEFDRLVGVGEPRIEPAFVQRDLDNLSAVTEGVRRFANRRIAHRDAREIEKRKFGELDRCVEVLAATGDRYARILTGSGSGIRPDLPEDWLSVFKKAWMKETQRED
jgi:hypothetical protein